MHLISQTPQKLFHKLLAFFSISMVSMFAASASTANPTPAEANAIAVIGEITDVMGDQTSAELAESILVRIDVDAFSRFVLGHHGRRIDTSERAEFTFVLKAYLRRQIMSNAHQIKDSKVSIIGATQRNTKDVVVTTRVDTEGEIMTLRWRIIKRENEWGLIDMEFAGIWLAIEQRAQIAAMLNSSNGSIESIIAAYK